MAIKKYQQFVSEGKGLPSIWRQLRSQIYLGSDNFVENTQALIDGDKELSEVPSSQRRLKPKCLSDYKKMGINRNDSIVKAYQSGGYTLKAIGDYFDLHYSTVSGIIRNHKSKT